MIQQMDIKGAYLNGYLKETVYMCQPEGFDNGTNHVCLLVKTLYGLKQFGCKWNIEFNKKIHQKGFIHLQVDPCMYIKRQNNEVAIITIWVDDLLLFTGSSQTMNEMKKDLHSQWEVTDLGKPSKIIGIKITRSDDVIKISQKRSIESILTRQGLKEASPVSTPLDPKVKIKPNPKHQENGNFLNVLLCPYCLKT